MRKALFVIFVGLALLCGGLRSAGADSELPREYLIKVAFLYNFAKFIQWPDSAFSNPQAPIKIGVVGDEKLGQALATIESKTINARQIAVDQPDNVAGLDGYHLVFVSRIKREMIDEILSHLDGKPVLTISDEENFSRRGGIIYLFKKGNKIRFNVNMEPASRNHLKISSKLLKLAEVVEQQTVEKSSNGSDQ